MRRGNGAASCSLLLGVCGLVFTCFALATSWWNVSLETLSSTDPDITAGYTEHPSFLLSVIQYQSSDGDSIQWNYSEFNADSSTFSQIRGITITLICFTALITFYAGSLVFLQLGHHKRIIPQAFCCLSFASLVLAATNLALLSAVPSKMFASVTTCPVDSCNAIWSSSTFEATGSVGTTITYQFQTAAGPGWWWTVSAMMTFVLLIRALWTISSRSTKSADDSEFSVHKVVKVDHPSCDSSTLTDIELQSSAPQLPEDEDEDERVITA
eukprot:TRINITY_DN4210_c0_g1_i1.p1 TRINITY_DN4210_c0_g1~~TRINITY_DN4210_c0_g1_i1.p1  ORF type:complete len:269 (+),score=74.50 TRINITY_DN4210_c0_g1_i1:67-873(+)